jgi:hypothetical protein
LTIRTAELALPLGISPQFHGGNLFHAGVAARILSPLQRLRLMAGTLIVVWPAFWLESGVRLHLASVVNGSKGCCGMPPLRLLIVVLPLAELLPVLLTDLVPALRLLRILRLQQLGRFGRVYRLRALLTRMWRAFLLLELVQRLTGQTPQKRLRRLRELLGAKLEEVEQLQQEIARLEAQVQQSPNSPDSECTKQRLLSEH